MSEEQKHNPADVVFNVKNQDGEREEGLLLFWCPGCQRCHPFHVAPHPKAKWTWNGDRVKPTFSPSLLCAASDPSRRCHSFVRNGQIQFLSDCAHELAGQTVDLIPIDEV